MHSRKHAWRTRTTVLALGALLMTGAATIVGAPGASAATGRQLAKGQCTADLFSGANLTGDKVTLQSNQFGIFASSEPFDWQLIFDDVVFAGSPLQSANSVSVTCTFDSVDGNSTFIRALPEVNTTAPVPDPTANGCYKAEGVTTIGAGAVGVVKNYVSN